MPYYFSPIRKKEGKRVETRRDESDVQQHLKQHPIGTKIRGSNWKRCSYRISVTSTLSSSPLLTCIDKHFKKKNATQESYKLIIINIFWERRDYGLSSERRKEGRYSFSHSDDNKLLTSLPCYAPQIKPVLPREV